VHLYPEFLDVCRQFTSLFEVPVARAADNAKVGTGRVMLSPHDPCLVLGEGTRFLSEFAPKMQIMLSKSVNSPVAEIAEVLSDTELKIKKEFGGDSGKVTTRIREKLAELREKGEIGVDFRTLPFVDQQEMYRYVYQCLKEGGCIGIFPEGGHAGGGSRHADCAPHRR
jgi:glycerol-3-phosphate O-acyltransferase/dihydroxyacetone phosphate acyltransferase